MVSETRIAFINVPETLEAPLLSGLSALLPDIGLDFHQDGEGCDVIDFGDIRKPLRLGELADKITRQLRMADQPKFIDIGAYRLNIAQAEWFERGDDAHVKRLTDKERDLIVALYQAPKRHLSRQELLAAVWGYVEGLETHTLETHIYRLRQKIEADPSNPEILLTSEDGYHLNGC